MLVFSWQLAVNFRQFGSIFIWPYSLHYGADKGFELSMFLNGGLHFLIQTNLMYMTAGVTGMFFQRKHDTRNIFVLWAFPLIIFFCGYVCVAASPIRFILPAYGALIGAFVCMDIWRDYDRKTLAFIIIVIALNYLLVAPPFKYLLFNYPLQPLNLGRSFEGFYIQAFLHIAVPLLSIISSAFLLWKKKELLIFITVFFLIYYSGSSPVIFLLMIVMLFITALSVLRQIYCFFFRRNAS